MRSIPRRALVVLLIAAAFQTASASAIVYLMPTDESMVDRSPIIVFGEVLSAQPGAAGASPTTEYLFAVEEVLKGFVAGSGIMVRQPGGVGVDGVAMRIGGLPMLAEGDRVLLFLRAETNGAHSIVEYALGMFWEVDVGGQLLLVREASLEDAVPLAGDATAAALPNRSLPRNADRFRRWIADRTTGLTRPSDYFEADVPDTPVAVAQPYRLFRTDQESCWPDLPLRWQAFDLGEPLGFVVDAGGQDGVPGGGLSQLRRGMQVWNDDSRSRTNLVVQRTTNAAPPAYEADGVHSIVYEDAYDEIEGSFDPDGGGTLAIGGVLYRTCAGHHTIPGGVEAAVQAVEGYIVTQDGLGDYLRSGAVTSPANYFERIIAHELGHAIGIDHPCEPEEAGCNNSHEDWGALMWPIANPTDTSRARLHEDDRDAARRLYPTETDSRAPDLVVESPRSTVTSVAPSGAFRFAATVRNNGDSRSAATTLRYYRSSDSRITTSDTSVGTDSVGALTASGTDRQSIGQRAPSTPGTYYYGACVDSVSGETDTTNNCSSGVPISVVGATSSCSGDTCLLQGERFRVKARYSKAGAPGQSAGAVEAALADSAGLFSAESDSPELLVRIVNQCRATGYWEVYAGVASDADFSVAVRHVETNELKWFRTRDRQSIADTEAFACTRSDDRASPADPGDGTGDAACSGATCLLQEDRFRVKSWYAHDGGSSQAADAILVDLGESAGLFAFDGGNPELLVRIADTCSTSGYWAVYAGTAAAADFSVAIRDTETNELKWFRSQDGQSVADAEAFRCTGSDNGTPPANPDDSACSGDTCLLQGERFRVKARYSKAGAPGQSAGAVEAALADSAGLFSAESDSPELLVRIVNQCRATGYWEVYAGVASDADFSVAVRHVETNELKWFRTRDRQSIADTEAFACTRSDDRASPADPGDGTGDAACSGATCLLQEDRFRVKSWYAHDGGSSQAADAILVDLGESAGLFAFDGGNPELLVRIADTCSTSGYWAVYAGTAAAADFSVAIRDTETNELKWFRSRGGQSVADAEAFACGATGNSGFDLGPDNSWPQGMTYALGRFYVVDYLDRKVYAYRGSDGRQDADAGFDLAPNNSWPEGVTYAQDRLYVVDYVDEKAYAYRTSDGRYDSLADFDLATGNTRPRGITYAQGRFYVVDYLDRKVYAYRGSDGHRDAAADFDLAPDNSSPEGIAYAQDRLYVVDSVDDRVYAYRVSDGGRDPLAGFDLAPDNSSPEGITYAGGKLFVIDSSDDKVYAYSLDGSGDGATDDHGDTFADATPVAVPSTTAGELEASGDYDYFRLVVDESTTLTVETTGSTDTYGTLFDGSGSSLASDDDYGAGLNFKIEREVEAGTYYVRVRGYAFSTGAYELRVSTSGGGSSSPDLVVQSPSVDDTSLTAGQSFTFRITVRNRGDGRSASTTLRYYRSSNSTISASDTQVGTDAVGALAASGSSAESISLTAPSSAGTYYYGACVDSVLRESSTGNNCSQGVRVTVSGDGGGLFSGSVTRCSGSETTSGTWNITIGGNVRANQSVSNVTATGYVEPVKRRVGSQFLGSFAPNQTKNFNITGTVSGVAPTRCEVEVRGTRDNANAKALRLSAPLERAEREP